MREIKTVTILGANGMMGANCSGLIAGFGGCRVHMLARDIKSAEKGKIRAMESIRSDAIADRLVPGTYDIDLEHAVSESDWVLEVLAEDKELKMSYSRRIAPFLRSDAIMSTGTSGIPISKLITALPSELRSNYFGTHFFNPPYKMLLCELIIPPESDRATADQLASYLEHSLLREVVRTRDEPAFAANRIGFYLLNAAALMAEEMAEEGGISFVDAALGGFTGRVMSPMRTMDLVGLDTHKAIVDNVFQSSREPGFRLPEFVARLVDLGLLGDKTGGGLYRDVTLDNAVRQRQVFDIASETYLPAPRIEMPFATKANALIAMARYSDAARVIKESSSRGARCCRDLVAKYISYAFSIAPDVLESPGDLERIMGFGFNWASPLAWVAFLGGIAETERFLAKAGSPIPEGLLALDEAGCSSTVFRDARTFFRASRKNEGGSSCE